MASRRCLGRLGVVLVAAHMVLFVSAQECLLAAEERETPFRNIKSAPVLPSGTQAIITSYKFECCGNITTWQTYVLPGGSGHQGAYDITFQVWRPSPTVLDNGCYSRVGENIFTSISLDDACLVSETPEPSNILTVHPGDVVGYLTISRENPESSGIQLDDSHSIDSVWYHINTDSDTLIIGAPSCPFPVGTEPGRVLRSSTNAAPVLSVGVSSFTCPPTPTIYPSSTSSLPPSNTASAATTTSPNTEGTSVIASIAAVWGSALLLCLLSMLVLAITLAKVQHKRQRALTETPSIVADQQVNTLSMEMKENEAYMTTSHTTDECYATIITTESNLAYGTVNTGSEDQNNEYDDILQAEPHYYT